ncbi:MAG: T9SS type A sorting domain-containing protein, partial [Bacteroidota bacterium]|nr:T9SS type A sorting domain-containing protein [Bacteroidota bacterium]MDX5431063.1 T9SS type A sorting domain-containing protein [Bacteroidota bacterium]MDX5469817.1 T9SS type A sorting domain-containing protein [Bacteroidota bacterium]
NRNPGLYSNLANFPDLLHVSYHPSSPYKQCPLNQYNTEGNDHRTNFYGVYGSTPRIVVNGIALSAQTNYASSQFIDAVNADQSNYSLEVQWSTIGSGDSVQLEVIITLEATSNENSGKLFIGLFQDTVYQTNQNGEKNPAHVYRGGPLGLNATSLPVEVGSSITYTVTLPALNNLGNASLFAVAVLYNEANEYLQAERSASHALIPTGIQHTEMHPFSIYPNPTRGSLRHTAGVSVPVVFRDLQGKTLYEGLWLAGETLNMNLKPGVYLLESEWKGNRFTQRLLIEP